MLIINKQNISVRVKLYHQICKVYELVVKNRGVNRTGSNAGRVG